eukprot:TRINITY_DN11505_c0_g1_i1.p1 TRINITY_DN11505_c0_g1~~TRINITY_DN11505_c0_g1_i1.p1  ORF type:complete len:971 (+),score=168.94 TRINITY_DN11505_c0_g1_i1:92-3004(+)
MGVWDGRRCNSRSGSGRPRMKNAQKHPGHADTHHDGGDDHNVRVFVRARPLLPHEAGDGDHMRALRILEDGKSVYIKDRFVDEKILTFNRVFGPDAHQQEVFEDVGVPACTAALSGLFGSVVTYGQTGTGKTYTAFNTEPGSEGLMVRCVQHVFDAIQRDARHSYTVYVQYLQLYKEQISDLLDEQGTVEIREDHEKGVYIKGATTIPVRSPSHVLSLFDTGNKSRVVRLTTMNAQSSRSHALFLLSVKRVPKGVGEGHPESVGRLTLVDLAGSERIKRTHADSLRRQEAQSINMSLSCLGTVIHALTDPKSSHVPYRSCKLTRILRNSLGEYGNASIVVTISSALADVSETLGSLYFGTRALCVRQTYTIPQEVVMQEKAEDVDVKNLEYQVAFLEANNTQLREAAQEDETLIEELSHQIKKAVHQQDRIVGERCAASQEVETLRRKVGSYSRALRERDAAMEDVLTQELGMQQEEYELRVRGMQAVIEEQRERLSALETRPPVQDEAKAEAEEAAPAHDDEHTDQAGLPGDMEGGRRCEGDGALICGHHQPCFRPTCTGAHTSLERAMVKQREEFSVRIDELTRTVESQQALIEQIPDGIVARLQQEHCAPAATPTSLPFGASVASGLTGWDTSASVSSSPPIGPPPPRAASVQTTTDSEVQTASWDDAALVEVQAAARATQTASTAALQEECARWRAEVVRAREEAARLRVEQREDRALMCALIKERDALLRRCNEQRAGSSTTTTATTPTIQARTSADRLPVPPLPLPSRTTCEDGSSVPTARSCGSSSRATTVPAARVSSEEDVFGPPTTRTQPPPCPRIPGAACDASTTAAALEASHRSVSEAAVFRPSRDREVKARHANVFVSDALPPLSPSASHRPTAPHASPALADQIAARLRRAASGVTPREGSSSVDRESILGTFAVESPFPDCAPQQRYSDAMRGMEQIFARVQARCTETHQPALQYP